MNMWPEDIGHNIPSKSPAAILREQASLLGNKTKNIVTAEVKRNNIDNRMFYYEFYIVAPSYSYRYKLFGIVYGIEQYPVFFLIEDDDIKKGLAEYKPNVLETLIQNSGRTIDGFPIPAKDLPRAESEDKFLEILGKIFSAEKTKMIINALITESQV